MKRTAIALLIAAATALSSHALQATFPATHQWAWGGNIGWIGHVPGRPGAGDGVRVYDRWLGGYAWAPNIGWIDFGDGLPQNTVRYGNTNHLDYGVNHDGAGRLSGLAWAPNIGWIHFGWATNGDPNQPRFALDTGDFSGLAWAPNAGWINLGTGLLRTESIAIVDLDGDGISDSWEYAQVGNTTMMGGTTDSDNDGIKDWQEYVADTHPTNSGGGVQMTAIGNLSMPDVGFISWSSSPARVYRIDFTTNLAANAWQDAGIYAGSPSNTTTQAFVALLTNLHFRAVAKLPLTP